VRLVIAIWLLFSRPIRPPSCPLFCIVMFIMH
jgi:hypothetical protein